jgi:DNA-binding NarL/FixJ family response regulator
MMHKVLLGEDNEGLRQAVKNLLAQYEGWSVCGEASNGREAVEMAAALQPDVIVLDFRMPELNGLFAAAEILSARPSAAVILYTLHADARLESQAKALGVRRVISKTEPFSVLLESMRELVADAKPVGPLAISATPSPTAGAETSITASATDNTTENAPEKAIGKTPMS